MVARLRALWQHIKKPLEIIAVTLFLVGLLVLIVLIILGYKYNLDWTGLTSGYSKVTTIKTPQGATITTGQLPAKSLWDWLQLLIIPAVLAVGGYVFNITVSRNERKAAASRDKTEHDIAADNQQEAALQDYIDKMSELLIDKKLRDSSEDDEVRKIARVRTLTVLPRLDKHRKKSVLQFLHESGLIKKDASIIKLIDADLQGVILRTVNLRDADLDHVNLCGADLRMANMRGSTLEHANLSKTNLSKAMLSDADLGGADLRDADLRGADLRDATLEEAILDDLDKTDLSEIFRVIDFDKPRRRITPSTLILINTYHPTPLTDIMLVKLIGANLSGADLRGATMHGVVLLRADLRGANLGGAIITSKQMKNIKSLTLKNAWMPDGSIHP